jgi:hypothetical protein
MFSDRDLCFGLRAGSPSRGKGASGGLFKMFRVLRFALRVKCFAFRVILCALLIDDYSDQTTIFCHSKEKGRRNLKAAVTNKDRFALLTKTKKPAETGLCVEKFLIICF